MTLRPTDAVRPHPSVRTHAQVGSPGPLSVPGNRWLSPEEGAALKQRKEVVVRRLEELTGGLKPLQRQAILERKETHWDFLVKEMKWMAGDFENERKLHNKQRRKVRPCTHPSVCMCV
jgi:hypothetical protein